MSQILQRLKAFPMQPGWLHRLNEMLCSMLRASGKSDPSLVEPANFTSSSVKHMISAMTVLSLWYYA